MATDKFEKKHLDKKFLSGQLADMASNKSTSNRERSTCYSDSEFSTTIHMDPGLLLVLLEEDDGWSADFELPCDDIIVEKPSGAVDGMKPPTTPPLDTLEALEDNAVDDDKWDDWGLDTIGSMEAENMQPGAGR
ncbi:hypothetical protein HDU96_010571 [Phlyctochytrium bullatum]|nr:hypothetical protein HDU96_010571 [Phlyctochytrium bullatum]